MVKLTKRKGFNFFRSYFDVYNELENNEDKIAFIDALLDRQFLGVKPLNLKGMAKFAYISQTNSIDSQVKGYEDKTGNILDPCQPPSVGVKTPPSLQEEVKEEEKVEVKEKVEINKNDLIFNELTISQIWLEKTAMHSNAKFSVNEVKVQLKKYNDMINLQFDKKTNKTEYCTHFINWLNKQQKESGPTKKRIISWQIYIVGN